MNHRTNRFARIGVVAVLLVIMPLIGQSTAPLPLPYAQFTVTGEVHREDGGSPESFPVVLVHLTVYAPDGYQILRNSTGAGRDVALTDADGEFLLSLMTHLERTDTIAVAVALPEGEIYFGEPIYVDSLTFGTHSNWYKIENSGYCESDEIVEYTEGYLYSINEQSVTIPAN